MKNAPSNKLNGFLSNRFLIIVCPVLGLRVVDHERIIIVIIILTKWTY